MVIWRVSFKDVYQKDKLNYAEKFVLLNIIHYFYQNINMKRIENFLTKNPGYCKVSIAKVAERLKLSPKTVKRFWGTECFKTIKSNYFNTLKNS